MKDRGSAAERVLYAVFRPLAILAAMYGFVPPPYAVAHLLGRSAGAAPAAGPLPRALRPPGRAHPERVLPDLPLSEAELVMQRQLGRHRLLSHPEGW
ncbi:DUF6059 family protein [Kitasatospora sp. GP82]|uniref:DUF6059 family protein n=1 Tax=Kitasatospora sp. GP82 TaxID=3035089 RepID=UPI0024740FAA|nr:DUF6059 family protein [Kitasatospora sp. GP82]MDH6129089.1 hypothetical protein [Kitasatospora sp. GP82]